MSIHIFTDSTADLNPVVRNKVSVIPLNIRFGDDEFIDGVTITTAQFYEKLLKSDLLPTTSQAAPYDFEDAFRSAVSSGDTVIVITLSSKLSGTYQSACIAAAEFPGKVFVVDSLSVAIGSAILVQYALELAQNGLDAETIVRKLTQKREKIRLIALLDTLEYLKKGGRISSAAALAGSLLNIKPLICIENGEIKMLGKARGNKQGNQMMIQTVEKSGGIDFTKPLMLGYTGLDTAMLEKFTADAADLWADHMQVPPSTVVGSVVGTHAGPGAVAIAFFSAGA